MTPTQRSTPSLASSSSRRRRGPDRPIAGTAAFRSTRAPAWGASALILTLVLSVPGCGPSDDGPPPPAPIDVETLTERHVEAVGGREALDRVRSVEVEMTIVEPAYTLDALYRGHRDGKMRIDVFAGDERVFTEAFDGEVAWQMGADTTEVTIADEQATEALWRGTQYPGNVLALYDLEERGHDVRLVGRDTLDGTAYHVLELEMSDGFRTYRYVHPETWLIDRARDVRAIHPDLDPTEKPMETRWSDFRPVDGVLRPHRSEQREIESDSVVQRTTIHEIRVNPELPEDVFEPPGG